MEPLSDDDLAKMVQCPACGVKNRIPAAKLHAVARCGKCGTVLPEQGEATGKREFYVFRCPECRTRNRVPSDKIKTTPACGKCKSPLKTGELFLNQPLLINDANFEAQVLKSPLPVLLFAWAPWCPTCRAFLPIIDAFGRESKGRVRVGKLNVDQSPAISSRYSILSVPQIFIFDGGELRETLPGAMQKHEIMMKMADYL